MNLKHEIDQFEINVDIDPYHQNTSDNAIITTSYSGIFVNWNNELLYWKDILSGEALGMNDCYNLRAVICHMKKAS